MCGFRKRWVYQGGNKSKESEISACWSSCLGRQNLEGRVVMRAQLDSTWWKLKLVASESGRAQRCSQSEAIEGWEKIIELRPNASRWIWNRRQEKWPRVTFKGRESLGALPEAPFTGRAPTEFTIEKSSRNVRKLSGYIISLHYFKNQFLNIIFLLTFKHKCLKSWKYK